MILILLSPRRVGLESSPVTPNGHRTFCQVRLSGNNTKWNNYFSIALLSSSEAITHIYNLGSLRERKLHLRNYGIEGGTIFPFESKMARHFTGRSREVSA
mmetsp:Transcript_43637/g.50198  ORF Transcript_43637/g.50198 Transcript_43637/m.50198 type:complete len:100 (+) Transcript_43637:224-523(+)